jgi:hypothetical protein
VFLQLVFLDGSRASFDVSIARTACAVAVRARRGVDPTVPPFHAHDAAISSPTSHAHRQPGADASTSRRSCSRERRVAERRFLTRTRESLGCLIVSRGVTS